MSKTLTPLNFLTGTILLLGLFMAHFAVAQEMQPVVKPTAAPFVVQLTRSNDYNGHIKVFRQIDKVLDEIGEEKLNIHVVAYEDGIHALLTSHEKTAQLLTKLANRGVTFKACRISMKAWGLEDEQFPLEVEYVPSGAPEMVRLQMQNYKYWRP